MAFQRNRQRVAQGRNRNRFYQTPGGGNWRTEVTAASPALADHCEDAGGVPLSFDECQDLKCLKRHSLPLEFDMAFSSNTIIRGSMKINFKRAMHCVDEEIMQAKRNLIENDSEAGHEQVKQLIAQKTAFCKGCIQKLNRPDIISIIWRELYRLNGRLPALAKRLELETAIRSNVFIMVVGATGSGKSTQIPQYILDMPENFGKKVICTQPRRVATVSLADRVALEYAGGYRRRGRIGGKVGFRIGGMSRRGPQTCLEYMTEGMLLQAVAEKLSRDSDHNQSETEAERLSLESVAAVIVDEVHERHLLTDFLIGLLKAKQRERYKDLKVIISSATIDNVKFSKYLGNCPIINIPGRTFPVDITFEENCLDHLPASSRGRDLLVRAIVKKAIEVTKTTDSGHVLCFLTGQGEIEDASRTFRHNLPLRVERERSQSVVTHVLYGKMTPEEQQRVVKPRADDKRKVIFSTDVAETSVTIDGVAVVIDSGYSKEVVYDAEKDVTVLKTFPISKSSADQRAGRAGRTAPGVCYRLYSKSFYDKMKPFPKPEIQRKSLSLTMTTLLATGQDPGTFEWIDPPSQHAIGSALRELRLLGIVDGNHVTEVGRFISCLQMDPSLGRMIVYACRQEMGEAAVILAAIMMTSFSFFSADKRSNYWSASGELVSSYRAFCDWLDLKNLDDAEAKSAAAAKNDEKAPKSDTSKKYTDDEANSSEEEDPDAGKETNEIEMIVPRTLENALDEEDYESLQDTMLTSERIRSWADKNCVVSDACYMTYLEKVQLENRLKSRGLWKMSRHQNRKMNDEEVQMLILSALCKNIAKNNEIMFSHQPLYTILATKSDGAITKESFIPKICRPLPQWIVFHEATSFGHFYHLLQRITPIQKEWISGNINLCQIPDGIRQLVIQEMASDTSE